MPEVSTTNNTDHGLRQLLPPRLTEERLQLIVNALCIRLHDTELRSQSQRAIQAKIWHLEPSISQLMRDLKHDEQQIQTLLLNKISTLVYEFHSHTLDATLARAGLTSDPRLSVQQQQQQLQNGDEKNNNTVGLTTTSDLDLRCLDAKERLYVLLQQYGWLPTFFASFPHHFYENSFSFVSRIPPKSLPCNVKVIGLGVGGSMALSGMAKHGIRVVGVEKRNNPTSRYQNASWRAYDTAHHMVDEQAFEELSLHRQRILTNGTIQTFSDRVQIVIGHAVDTALQSAKRYGAQLHIGDESKEQVKDDTLYDLCVVFCGAHTSKSFPILNMNVISWPHLESECKMWLQVFPHQQESDTAEGTDDPSGTNSCTRQGEIGAEHWNFTIATTRHSEDDLERLLYNLDSQHSYYTKKKQQNGETNSAVTNGNDAQKGDDDAVTIMYKEQRRRVMQVLDDLRQKRIRNYQYVFTNAPDNEHNLAKRDAVADTIVVDGGYNVPIQMARQSTFRGSELISTFQSELVVCGGDACVPPNPLAAYGATLACEAAHSSVQLAIGIGHLNAMLEYMDDHPTWITAIQELKTLLVIHYEARARAENYFQFIQTLLCNLYSLPPQDAKEAQ